MLLLPHFDLATHEKPRIEHVASAALAASPRTITSARNPRSAGGANDFSSEGDYWWPDPNNPDGPYIQRDGLSNPGNFVGIPHPARDDGQCRTGGERMIGGRGCGPKADGLAPIGRPGLLEECKSPAASCCSSA